MKYYYVDTGEMVSTPKKGLQYTAWFVGSSHNNPGGSEFSDIIKGHECRMRAMDEATLTKWLKTAFSRAPFIQARELIEGDE